MFQQYQTSDIKHVYELKNFTKLIGIKPLVNFLNKLKITLVLGKNHSKSVSTSFDKCDGHL